MKKLFIPLLLIISLVACKKNTVNPTINTTDSAGHVKTDTVAVPKMSEAEKKDIIKKTNDEILQALKNKDYQKFSEFIHPQKGIRFSMYAFVDLKDDKHFSKADFEKYVQTKTQFTWGSHDGSGELYKETIKDYLEKWVFSKDFTHSTYSFNEFQGGGNSLNNLKEIYPGHDFTENYIKGTEKYGEMDWKTLRFVYEEFEGKYYIIAVINDQWTV
ncbi:hypothetical protein AAEU33_10615 [Chryseobacterium sp. Chry.R1]|uniref:hypothetical protein n=1 Tax=Chryseobacterium sp. Chry.R1 TaxID=3139392 RepID=UPI0031FA0C30